MCLLTFYPGGVMPDLTAISQGAYWNRDGHGYAVVAADRIIVGHGMNSDALIAEFETVRATYPDGPALFHSRYGTHGSVGEWNCHPFRVGGDPRTVLAHNGILPNAVRPAKGDKRCDTRVAAEDFLPRNPFGRLTNRRSRAKLGQWITSANKLVILTVDPRYRSNAYIINEHAGMWDAGIWYSNSDYQCPLPGKTLWQEVCPTCLEHDSIDPAYGYCDLCGTCGDCGEPENSCACYVPSRAYSDTWLDDSWRDALDRIATKRLTNRM